MIRSLQRYVQKNADISDMADLIVPWRSIWLFDDIQEITFLGSCLMWNDTAVCCGRILLTFFVSVWSDL